MAHAEKEEDFLLALKKLHSSEPDLLIRIGEENFSSINATSLSWQRTEIILADNHDKLQHVAIDTRFMVLGGKIELQIRGTNADKSVDSDLKGNQQERAPLFICDYERSK